MLYGSSASYYVASRYFDLDSFGIRYISSNGNLYNGNLVINYNPWEGSGRFSFSVRPILTLRANLKYTGEGTKDSPKVVSF